MAKFSPYAQQQSLDTGADTLKQAPYENYAASGIVHGAREAESAFFEMGKADNRLNAKLEAQAKMAQGIFEHTEFYRVQGVENEAFNEAARTADPSGVGFVDEVKKGLDKRLETYVNSAPDVDAQIKRMERAEQLRTSTVKRALAHEDGLIRQGLQQAQQRTYADAGEIVKQMPDKNGYGLALKQVEDQANLLNLSPRAKDVFIRDGKAHLARAAIDGMIAARPDLVLEAGRDVFSGLPTASTTEQQKAVIDGANASGFDPLVLLGIGQIESRLDPSVRPIDRLGRVMSSAKGAFQFLDNSAYGQVDWKDTKGQATLLGSFLNRQKDRMQEAGIEATPGKLYMFHNVGEGVANKMLTSDPSKTMGQLLAEVYGGSRMKNGELWRDVVGRNNPGLYNPATTVGDAMLNYERKMSDAMGMHKGAVGTGGQTSQDVIDSRLEGLLGFKAEGVSTADMGKAVEIAKKQLEAGTKKRLDNEMGSAFLMNQARMSPNDPEHQKVVNGFMRESMPEFLEAFSRGDANAMAQARTMVANTSYIPKPLVERSRELVMSQGNVAQRTAAFEFLADIADNNHVAWNAGHVDKETQDRVNEYRARTKTSSPKEAIEGIDRWHTPEGKEQRKAVQQSLQGKTGELHKLSYDEIAKGVIGGGMLTRVPNVSGESGSASANSQALMMQEAREIYSDYRKDGKEPDIAKARTIEDLKKVYGPTSAFTSTFERTRLMKYPPERFYAGSTIGLQGFETQAREIVEAEMTRRYGRVASSSGGVQTSSSPTVAHSEALKAKLGGDDAKYQASGIDVRIVSTPQTERDVRAGNLPSYQIWYRDPKTGAPTLAYTPTQEADWRPNIDRIRREDREAWLADAKAHKFSDALRKWIVQTPNAKQLGQQLREQFK